jgi:threonine/homoserine/homoserine lactone efflux protein
MGFLAAIPIGATQLEIARRSINGYLSSALMIMVGSVMSDVMYGVIAFFGLASFLQDPQVVAIFWLVGAGILVVLGAWAIRDGLRFQAVDIESKRILQKHDVAFVTGFSLALTNPFMIVWWLLGARLMKDIGIIERIRTSETLLFLLMGGLGIASYLSLLAFLVHGVKKFFSQQAVQRITIAFGIVLLGLAAYFIVRSASALTGLKGVSAP